MKYDNGNRHKVSVSVCVCMSGNHCISSRRKTISLKFQNVIKLTNVGVLFCFLLFSFLFSFGAIVNSNHTAALFVIECEDLSVILCNAKSLTKKILHVKMKLKLKMCT